MLFTPEQTASLLHRQHCLVWQGLQQMGWDDVALLAQAKLDDVLAHGAAPTDSSCWRNRPQAKAAIDAVIVWTIQQRIKPWLH